MYFYTHVLNSLEAAQQTGGTNASSEVFDTSRRFTGSIVSTANPDESKTTSYSSGTRARSVTSIQATVSHSYYELTRTPTAFPDPGAYALTDSSTTISLAPLGGGLPTGSTGIDSWSYSQYATKTVSFETSWIGSRGSSTTLLTASATATDVNLQSTLSQTASGTTLVPIFAVDRATVRRWFVGRQYPPLGRRVGLGYAATQNASSAFVASLAGGTHRYISDLEISSTSYSGQTITGGFTFTDAFTEFSGKSISSSASAVPAISAARKLLFSENVVHDSSWGAGISLASLVAGLVLTAPVGSNLGTLSVWTHPSVHDSTTFCWSHQSGSWRLHATSSNSTSRSTYTIAFSVTGSLSSSTANAVSEIFNGDSAQVLTTVLLGPMIPATTDGLNVLSITTGTSRSGGQGLYTSVLQSSASSSSFTFSGSSSETSAFGTGSNYPATFASSAIRWAARLPAYTHQTATWKGGAGNPGAIPELLSNDKWNEAGRADAVAVIE